MQITGRWEHNSTSSSSSGYGSSSSSTAGTAGTSGSNGTLKISSIKMIADSCSAQ